MTKKILLADDDEDFRAVVKEILIDEGFDVVEASDGQSALAAFTNTSPLAALLDLKMPHLNGVELMKEITKIDPRIPVIILTAYGDIPTAVEAVKLGAYDFAPKPPDFPRLVVTMRRAIEKMELEMQVEQARSALELSLEGVLGRSRSIKRVIEQINRIAQTDVSVIIQGETGTGKTIVSQLIHSLSKRAEKPFVRVDVSLIPDSLAESELYGYKKGAFSGAVTNKAGYFETADGGTVFIDELENMSPLAQGKLLNFIDRKEVFRLGATESLSVDVRIISATNKDLHQAIKRKEFREDLYYRLGQFAITMPPLRERLEDVPFFVQKLLVEIGTELDIAVPGISEAAMEEMGKYRWPGNIRQLKNVIRSAVLFSNDRAVEVSHVEPFLKGDSVEKGDIQFASLREEMRALEKRRMKEALARTGGNKTKAAELLQVSYKNFHDKVKEYGLG